MYQYHEGRDKTNPNGICFLLLYYIANRLSDTVKELCIISDTCPGQSNNHIVVRLLQRQLLLRDSTKSLNTCSELSSGMYNSEHHTRRRENLNSHFEYFPIIGPCDRDIG
jgi:hypothetical protein